MSKKKKDVLKVQEESFISGAIKNGYSYQISKAFYDDILSFAQYGFNKSHAVAYSMIAYKMGYLKVHYSKYFYLSLLSMIIGSDSKTLQIVREAKNRGVKFLLPNINKSTEKYEIVDDGILFPFSNIRNIGVNTALDIINVRRDGFKNLFHCFTKLVEVGINRKNIESLVYASCFDCFGYNKNTIICNLDNLLTYAFIAKGLDSDIIEYPTIDEQPEFSRDILMLKEKELFGFYLSHHPTTVYKEKFKVVNLIDVERYCNKTIDTLILIEKIKYHTDKKGNKMAFITGSDEVSSCEYIIFSKVFGIISDVAKGDILLVRGKVERKETYQIIVEKAKIVS
jgi:DNA polymerase-3 subunit alpha